MRENDEWEDRIERSGNCSKGRVGIFEVKGKRQWKAKTRKTMKAYLPKPAAETEGSFI